MVYSLGQLPIQPELSSFATVRTVLNSQQAVKEKLQPEIS